MPIGVNEMGIPSLAANKISAAFCAVYMLAAVRQVLLKRLIIDKRSIAWFAEKRSTINE